MPAMPATRLCMGGIHVTSSKAPCMKHLGPKCLQSALGVYL